MTIGATAIWRVRPSGNNTNGGGYDPGIAGAATDYSQQNAAQATGTNGVTTGTTNFADATANAFTAAMIGNAIYITGTGQTTGFYFVTAVVDAANVTLDRSPGTGTGATWNLGGGWANFWTNTTAALVAGNIIYILGSGIPNPASYTYDYTMTTYFTPVTGLKFLNDPSTPSYKAPPDTTGGMPTIKTGATGVAFYNFDALISGLWFVAASGASSGTSLMYANGPVWLTGCVLDQAGNDLGMFRSDFGYIFALGCEVYSSTAPGAAGTGYAFGGSLPLVNCVVHSCNVHDVVGNGVYLATNSKLANCIVSKCRADGVRISTSYNVAILNNTIDGNAGHGITCTNYTISNNGVILNNIISNHTTSAKYGISLTNATLAMNKFMDYNVFYNNTADILSPLVYGPHDTHGGSNPYVGQAAENYTLA